MIEELKDGRYTVESASRPGEYHMIERVAGRVVCSCESYWFRDGPAGKPCKHMKALGEWLVLRRVG